jgi:hypothetical protein
VFVGGSEREVEDILLSERDGGKRAGAMAVLLMRSEPGGGKGREMAHKKLCTLIKILKNRAPE